MKSEQRIPNELAIQTYCKSSRSWIRDKFPDYERLWSACKCYPEVKYRVEPGNKRLVVEHSMIFRRAGGKIYKSTVTNRIYCDALDTMKLETVRLIFEGWTRDFLERVERAKAIRDEIATNLTG